MRRFFAPITAAVIALGALLLSFNATAFAAGEVAPTDGSLLDLARPVFDEVMKGHYIAAAALALVLCVALVKRYAPGKFGDFVHGDAGGALTTLLMAFGGALATATMGGATWTWGMCWTALTVAFAAAGGYALIKKLLVEPVLKPLSLKAPAWMQPMFSILFWVFDKKVSEAKIEADAVKAGDAAVAAQPSTGVAGIVGSPTEIK